MGGDHSVQKSSGEEKMEPGFYHKKIKTVLGSKIKGKLENEFVHCVPLFHNSVLLFRQVRIEKTKVESQNKAEKVDEFKLFHHVLSPVISLKKRIKTITLQESSFKEENGEDEEEEEVSTRIGREYIPRIHPISFLEHDSSRRRFFIMFFPTYASLCSVTSENMNEIVKIKDLEIPDTESKGPQLLVNDFLDLESTNWKKGNSVVFSMKYNRDGDCKTYQIDLQDNFTDHEHGSSLKIKKMTEIGVGLRNYHLKSQTLFEDFSLLVLFFNHESEKSLRYINLETKSSSNEKACIDPEFFKKNDIDNVLIQPYQEKFLVSTSTIQATVHFHQFDPTKELFIPFKSFTLGEQSSYSYATRTVKNGVGYNYNRSLFFDNSDVQRNSIIYMFEELTRGCDDCTISKVTVDLDRDESDNTISKKELIEFQKALPEMMCISKSFFYSSYGLFCFHCNHYRSGLDFWNFVLICK